MVLGNESVAVDADGTPSKAAEGFARGCGVTVAELQQKSDGKITKLLFVSTQAGDNTANLVPDMVRAALAGSKGVREIRNKGLMIGIELDMECNQLVKDALADGLLINVTADNVVRLLPPLNMQRAEAEQLVKQLGALINRFLANVGAAQAAVKTA